MCQEEIDSSQMSYSAQFSQKQPYGEGLKGKFVSSSNKADFCGNCFRKVCLGNFNVRWKTMQKIDDKWQEIDPQEKLEA
jgi:hypothetical protein